MHLMGIDVGSSTVKVAVYDEEMHLIRVVERSYAVKNCGEDRCETPVETVWTLVCAAIQEAATGLDVSAISATSFGEAAIPVDQAGCVLHDNILYTDRRGEEAFAQIVHDIGADQIYATTGAQPHPMYSVYKMAWLLKNAPKAMERVSAFHQMADFILRRLGARPHMDASLCARTQAFDVIHKKWSAAVIAAAGLDESLLPEAVASGTVVGQVPARLAESLNLSKRCLLVAGGHDQPCMALGTGAVRSGLASDGMGTVECIVPVADHPTMNEQMRKANFACAPHVLPDKYVTFAFNQCAGALVNWYRQVFLNDGQSFSDMFNDMADDACGLMMTPYFTGAATPRMDPNACGALVGLKIDHGRAHILRALAEGMNYEMMLNVQCLRRAGFLIDRLTAAGGLSRSSRLMQLKANMMGLPVAVSDMEHAGCKGTALLAGQALGLFDAAAMALHTMKIKHTYLPDAIEHARYAERLADYASLYERTCGFR